MEQREPLDTLFLEASNTFFSRFQKQQDVITDLLTALSNKFPQQSLLQRHTRAKGCKISKGNQLGGCPYQVLDIVRDFDVQEGFNIRLLAWWGHGFFIFAYFGKHTFLRKCQEITDHFGDYYWNHSETPHDYPNIIKQRQKLPTIGLENVKDQEHTIQIWKKLTPSHQLADNEAYMMAELSRLLDIHR